MKHPHPWRRLREVWPHLDLVFADLPAGTWGLSTPEAIWLDRGLSQAERRCTLEHELVHREWGHVGCQDAATEAAVHRVVARRLVPYALLASALPWAATVEELAEELWVDEETVRVRLAHLHPSERVKLLALLEDREGVSG